MHREVVITAALAISMALLLIVAFIIYPGITFQ
jgi:hypothetical protein